jgi:hypothetical protein
MMMGFLMHQDVSRSQRKICNSGDATNFSYSEFTISVLTVVLVLKCNKLILINFMFKCLLLLWTGFVN